MDIIEAEQCLKSWLISGIVDGVQAWASLQELNDDHALLNVSPGTANAVLDGMCGVFNLRSLDFPTRY